MLRRYRLIFVIFGILGILALLLVRVRVEIKEEPVKFVAVNPKYLQLYSVSPTRHGGHIVAITDREGRTWYRQATPLLDLSQCDVRETFASLASQGKGVVFITIRQPFRRDFAAWCADHLGEYIGVVIKGKLVRVEKCAVEIHSWFAIEFPSFKEAVTVADEIRAGGLYSEGSGYPE